MDDTDSKGPEPCNSSESPTSRCCAIRNSRVRKADVEGFTRSTKITNRARNKRVASLVEARVTLGGNKGPM